MHKKYYFSFPFLIIGTFFLLVSCQGKTPPIAPAKIDDYIMSFYTETIAKGDEKYLHKTLLMEFKKNGEYSGQINGQKTDAGFYTYRRSSDNTAELMTSYSDQFNHYSESNYINYLKFNDPTSGTFKVIYYDDNINPETGTFKILRHGY